MSLWGTSTADRSKPKFLKAGGRFSPDRCFATSRGWEYKHKNGKTELLIAITGLATALGGSQITEVFFDKATYNAGDVAVLSIVFSEAVTKTSGTPTLSVTTVSGLAGSPITFTYAAGSTTNTWTFTATLSNAAIPGEVLAVAGQTLGGGAVLADTAGGADVVDVAFVNGDRVGAAGSLTYANPVVTGATILKVAFTAATLSAAANTVSIKIKYNTPVTVTGTPQAIVAQTVSGNITLDYASGSGTDTLIFTKATAGLVQTRVVSITAQTLTLTGATITALAVNADATFINGDRTASDFSGAYADITVGA